MDIGPGAEHDLPQLRAVETAAGEAFRAVGMDAVADDAPPSLAELLRFLRADGLLVAREPAVGGTADGRPVAYVLLEPVDGCLHIEQVSVHPDRSRRGIGRALLDLAA
ncbi:hypothetical protein N566_14855, partial [Streptomycetaceae bacterium MP113-05]